MSEEHELFSEKGKEILGYAYMEGDTVLEFKEREDGTLMVMDITDHVRALEEKVTENGA